MRRRKLLLVFATAAIAVGVAATGWACVQTIGQLTVANTDQANWPGTSTAIGNGHHPGNGNDAYCVPPTPGAQAPEFKGFGASRPRVVVALSPSSQCNPFDADAIQPGHANTPGDGTYDVMFCPGKVYKTRAGSLLDITSPHDGSCYFTDGVGDAAVLMGQMTVTGGSGSATLALPGNTSNNNPGQYSGVSVREVTRAAQHGGPPYVNMAPISIAAL